ncbi:unnamed protein product [Leuciscus chuanchicus]
MRDCGRKAEVLTGSRADLLSVCHSHTCTALLSVSSQESRQRCQETDSARRAEPNTIGHDGHLAIAAKTEFTILTPRPSNFSQRGSIRSQLASETWTKPTRPPPRPHHGQDTFSDSTVEIDPNETPQTQTRPNNHQSIQPQPNRDTSIEHLRGNLKPPTTSVCIQHQQLVPETPEDHQNQSKQTSDENSDRITFGTLPEQTSETVPLAVLFQY